MFAWPWVVVVRCTMRRVAGLGRAGRVPWSKPERLCAGGRLTAGSSGSVGVSYPYPWHGPRHASRDWAALRWPGPWTSLAPGHLQPSGAVRVPRSRVWAPHGHGHAHLAHRHRRAGEPVVMRPPYAFPFSEKSIFYTRRKITAATTATTTAATPSAMGRRKPESALLSTSTSTDGSGVGGASR